MATPILTVRVPDTLLQKLQARATREHRTRSAMLVLLLEEVLGVVPVPVDKESLPSQSDDFYEHGVAIQHGAIQGRAS